MSGPTCVPGVVKKEGPIETPVSQTEKSKQGKAVEGQPRCLGGECPAEGTPQGGRVSWVPSRASQRS